MIGVLIAQKEIICKHDCSHRSKDRTNEIQELFKLRGWGKGCQQGTNDTYYDRSCFRTPSLVNADTTNGCRVNIQTSGSYCGKQDDNQCSPPYACLLHNHT